MIPRRLSVDDNHPLAPRLRISVNGIPQDKVFEFDCDEGRVGRYETAPDGRPVVTRDGRYSVETVRGKVEVTVV